MVAWVRRWVARRSDLVLTEDAHGNLLISIAGAPGGVPPIVAVAHMDHPGFVVDAVDGTMVEATFLGGVLAAFFSEAHVELFDSADTPLPGMVHHYDADTKKAVIETKTLPKALMPGDVGRWRFPPRWLGVFADRLRAHACDDLAGVAASLAALDKARKIPEAAGLSVLLTRAEEEGFIGAIGACKAHTVPPDARILSVETSRALPDAPVGAGPIIRVGDLASVFDHTLTNAVSQVVEDSGVPHQRKLMTGGACEATAFAAYGFAATGLAVALGGYHNMADIDGVRAGTAFARLAPEEISLPDFDGLVSMLVHIARNLDAWEPSLRTRLDRGFEERRGLLS